MLVEIINNDDSLDLEKDLAEIKRIKKLFAPYIVEDPSNQIRAYDPPLAWWNFDRFGYQNPEEFREHEQIQMETFLGERFGVTKRPAEFVIKEDGKVYSKDFPKQPFDVVLERGIVYRAEQSSDEQQREQSELSGWIKIREKLLDKKTPLGSEFIVISGPGILSTTNYPDNYIDLYVSRMDFRTKKRFIERKRFISGLSYNDYVNEFKDYKPDYFNDFKGPIDAWFLENPLLVNNGRKKLFADIFAEPKSKMPEKEFENIIADCMPFINAYINLLCVPENELNPEAVIDAYNAILILAGKLKDQHQKEEKKENVIYLNPDISIHQKIEYLSQFEVENVLAGCGLSGGFKRNRNKLVKQLFGNSVAKFGIEEVEDDYGPLKFQCTEGHWNTRPYGKLISKCQVENCTGSVCAKPTAA